ncbi:Uncharacterised protein [Klebsiella pneumoniae]|nr:hypothetical protein CHC10_04238 [Klebsiella pneumoniae]KMX43497.1 hypothetical protein SL85_02939 [Klebsiella pneumoniae]OUH29521.1 hypothetical protein AZ018_003091 [Klebsiella pneumoniae]SAW72170.1 Uncharacterised protein [Klebsiella pneumoniae]SSJ81724.1 Uncharacterised protein [Klebsiella pneumoniae]
MSIWLWYWPLTFCRYQKNRGIKNPAWWPGWIHKLNYWSIDAAFNIFS